MILNSNLLEKMCAAYGPSGREQRIRKMIAEEIKDYADDIKEDAIGNLIVHKKGNGKKIAVTAHMDQIGFMLRSVDDKGRFRVLPLGSIKPLNMIDTRVRTETGEQGVVLCEKKSADTTVSCDDLYIEFGMNPEKADSLDSFRGQEIVIKADYYENEDFIISGALDDRIGCFILAEVIKKIESCRNDMYFIFSVQEENGFQGIQSAISAVEPDLLLAVDVTCANEELRGMKTDTSVGKGAALKVMDHFMIVCQEVIEWLKMTASENGIPYQLDISDHGGTDACKAQRYQGVKAGAVCVPAKNIHSGNEIVSKSDVAACLGLIQAISDTEINF